MNEICNKCKWFKNECTHIEGACVQLDNDGRRPDSVEFSSMKEDAKRRDLTMNALFFDPIEEKIFDFVGGEKDLRKGIVRFVGSPSKRIMEDKLRMMRAIRFTSRMNFRLDDASWEAIKKHSAFIEDVSSERIHQEMDKILVADKPSIGIEMLKASGLLEIILPEVNLLWSCDQDPRWHSEGNVGIHSMMALDTVRRESDNINLLWAALLHDIGKPAAFKIENGRIKAHGHDKKGEDISRDILNRLRFSKNDIDDIVWIVGNHMRIKHAKDMKKAKLRRLVADDRLDGLVLVSKADSESAIRNDEVSGIDEHLGWIEKVESFVATLEDQIELPAPLISGKNLISWGHSPGPMFKKILDDVSELQLNDEIKTFEEAEEYVKQTY